MGTGKDVLKLDQLEGTDELLSVARIAWSRELEYLQGREKSLRGLLKELAAHKEIVEQSSLLKSQQRTMTHRLQEIQDRKAALQAEMQAAEKAAASGQGAAEGAAEAATANGQGAPEGAAADGAAEGTAAAGEQPAAQSEQGGSAPSNQHIADKESAFIVVNCPPDFCKVGDSVIPFDISRTLDHELSYAKTVFARGHCPTLTVNSIIQGVDGDCGSGVCSGTSLGAGDCEVISGSPTVRVEGKPVARNGDKVWMNDKNTWGYLQTLPPKPSAPSAKSSAPPKQQGQQQPKQPPSELGRSLEALAGYVEGVAAPVIMAVDGWKAIMSTPVAETANALVWGAGKAIGAVAEGYKNIFTSPGETYDALKWGAGKAWGKAKEILGGDDPRAAGKLIGEVVGAIAPLGMTKPLQGAKAVGAVKAAEAAKLASESARLSAATANAAAKAAPTAAEALRAAETATNAAAEAGRLAEEAANAAKLAKTAEATKLAEEAAQVSREAEALAAEARAAAEAKSAEEAATAARRGQGTRIEPRRSSHEGAAFGERTAHDKMVEKGYEPVGSTDGVYRPGERGIDGVYRNTNPPPDYIITDAKYDTAQLDKLTDGTRQMSDDWVLGDNRLVDKVGYEEAVNIREAMRTGSVEKWVIKVKPDGTSYARKVDADGYVIRDNTGKVPNF